MPRERGSCVSRRPGLPCLGGLFSFFWGKEKWTGPTFPSGFRFHPDARGIPVFVVAWRHPGKREYNVTYRAICEFALLTPLNYLFNYRDLIYMNFRPFVLVDCFRWTRFWGGDEHAAWSNLTILVCQTVPLSEMDWCDFWLFGLLLHMIYASGEGETHLTDRPDKKRGLGKFTFWKHPKAHLEIKIL